MRKRLFIVVVCALVVVSAAACGGDDSSSSPLGPSSATKAPSNSSGGSTSGSQGGSSAPSGAGSCEVKVSGDVTSSFTAQGGSGAVGSDYWLTDDDMRSALSVLAGSGAKSDADKKKAVDEAMAKDPRLYLLILNCVSGSGDTKNSLSILPSGASKYADVPFKAGQYTIPTGGLLGGADKPGEFSVLFGLGKSHFQVSKAGQLNITKFDKTGIAGTFTFGAQEGLAASGTQPKKITVEGKFDFPCTGGGNCKK